MKYTKSIYVVLTLIASLLTYQQHLGLNALILPIIFSVIHYILHQSIVSKRWFIAAFLWILSGLGVFLWHLDIGIPLFIICGFHFFAISFHSKMSLPASIAQSLISFFTGIGRFFLFDLQIFNTNNLNSNSKKIIRLLLIVCIPLLIFIIFLKLYQTANPDFAELTQFINFDFIEASFFFYFGLILIFSYGLIFFKPSAKVLEIDINSKDDLSKEEFNVDDSNSQLNLEWQIGIIVVSSLSLLLLGFIFIDFNTIYNNQNVGINHSQGVHQSINILITSIVLVIVIVLYLFRGAVNYKSSKALKISTFIWLGLNCTVILLILAKNNNYIDSWGLTHKRIGVYIYTILCFLGICYTVYKIEYRKTTSFLIRTTSTSFLSALVFYGLINWNGIIVTYNLNEKNLAPSKVDLQYLARLGPETYPKLTEYCTQNSINNEGLIYNLDKRIESLQMSYSSDWTDFLSYTYSGYTAYKKLEKYQSISLTDTYFHF
ncbi:MAG: DUF4153 domain-containing protein [Crocinitomicaceae bacterium]